MKTKPHTRLISLICIAICLAFSSCNSKEENSSIKKEHDKLKAEFENMTAASKSYNIFQEDWQADVFYDNEAFLVVAMGETWQQRFYIKDKSVFLIESLLTEINEKTVFYVEKDKLIHIIQTNTATEETIDIEVNDESKAGFNEAIFFYNDYIMPLMDNENFVSKVESLPGQDIEEGNEHFNYDAYLAYYAAENPTELQYWPKYIGTGDISYTIHYAGKFSSLFVEDENIQSRLKKLINREDYFESLHNWLLQDHNIEKIGDNLIKVQNPIKIDDKKIGWYNSKALFVVDVTSSKIHFAFYDQNEKATHLFSEGIDSNPSVKALFSEWVQ